MLVTALWELSGTEVEWTWRYGGIISESGGVKVFMPFIEFEHAYNIVTYGLAIEFTLIDFGY